MSLRNFDVDEAFAVAHHGLENGPHVKLSVRDEGCGMSKATQRQIFEPFFATKDPGMGTGLGLSVAHGIVAALGGISPSSVNWARVHGSMFIFRVPKLPPANPNPTSRHSGAATSGCC